MIRSVKVLSVFLAAVMTVPSASALTGELRTIAAEKKSATEPDKAAIAFLEKVRTRTLDLEPGGDTALSAQTAEEKRRQIAKRIEKMAKDLGTDSLEVGAVKQDENFAAVLIHKVGGFDPGRLQVFPVALVKGDSGWEAAPVPGSFENSGVGYAVALQKRIEQLENWMLREQVADLEKLRDRTTRLVRQKIEAKLPEADLRKLDVEKTGQRFLTACGSGDLASLLGVLGGLGSPLPEDWSSRLRSAETALNAGAAAPRPWRLLTSPDVARVLVAHQKNEETGRISIGCLDPAGGDNARPRVEVIHFDLSKSRDGLWRVDPPAPYLHEREKSKADADEEDEPAAESESNAEVAGLFANSWTSHHPNTPKPDAETASQAWLAALREGSFPSFLAASKIDTGSTTSLRSCAAAARIWQSLRGGSADFVTPIAFKAEESRAAGIYQFFSAHDPDRLDARPVYFEKTPAGWLCTPEPSSASREGFEAWTEEQSLRLQDDWQRQVLANCPVVADVGGLEAPAEEEARNCVEQWLAALRRGDVNAAIGLIARLDTPRSAGTALQNLGYEIAAARGKAESPPILGIYQSKPWAAAGVRIDGKAGKSTFPLHTVVKTDRGARILMEIDLVSATNRGRDFLNSAALARLGKATGNEAEMALRNLLQQYQTEVEKIPVKAPR